MGIFQKLFNPDKISSKLASVQELDHELFNSNLHKWRNCRQVEHLDPSQVNEAFNFLIENDLFSQELNGYLPTYLEFGYYSGTKSDIVTALLVNNPTSFCYEAELDSLTHPYDFNRFFQEDIAPILEHNGIKSIEFVYTKEQIESDFNYEFEFKHTEFSVMAKSSSDSEFLNTFINALNQLLAKVNHDKRFYDLIGTTKILLDSAQLMAIQKLPGVHVQ